MSFWTRTLLTVGLSGLLVTTFAGYRSHLLKDGYNKAETEFRQAEKELVEKHGKDVEELLDKTKELQNAHKEKSNEINAYRNRLADTSQRLREQQALNDRRIEDASCGSLREYANAVTRNFDEARGHVERLGLEAAECSATAETLKEALDLANGQSPDVAY
jgi:predicted RNase H-like nuclease (RuvC/YqgF family)